MTSTPPATRDGLGRRAFLRRSAAAALAGPAVLSACTSGDGEGDATPTPRDPRNPLDVDGSAPLEVVVHAGGYGEDYAEAHGDIYRRRHAGAKVEHASVEKVDTELRPRFVAGSPPDVVDNSGGDPMDLRALATQGQVRDLADVLEAPSLDIEDKTVRDTLLPGSLRVGTVDGRVRALPYAVTVWGFWYDAKTFRDNGWEYPRTWDALLALSGAIARDGDVSPFVWPGKDPRYLRYPLHAMAFRITGEDVWQAVDNLEPNAWRNDAIGQAVQAWYELARTGHVYPRAAALSPSDARKRWLQRKAAVLPSGSWLAGVTDGVPGDFEMTVAPPPSVTTGDKVPSDALSYVAGEPFVVPTEARNAAGGLDYLRVMCSAEGARKFAELTRCPTVVAGVHGDQVLGEGFASTTRAIEKARQLPLVPDPRYPDWYPPLAESVDAALAALMTGKSDPDETITRIQQKADQVAKDDRILNRTR